MQFFFVHTQDVPIEEFFIRIPSQGLIQYAYMCALSRLATKLVLQDHHLVTLPATKMLCSLNLSHCASLTANCLLYLSDMPSLTFLDLSYCRYALVDVLVATLFCYARLSTQQLSDAVVFWGSKTHACRDISPSGYCNLPRSLVHLNLSHMNEYRTPLFMHLTRLSGLQHLDLSCNDSLITGTFSLLVSLSLYVCDDMYGLVQQVMTFQSTD